MRHRSGRGIGTTERKTEKTSGRGCQGAQGASRDYRRCRDYPAARFLYPAGNAGRDSRAMASTMPTSAALARPAN